MNICDQPASEGKLERIPIRELVYSSNIPDKLLSLPAKSPFIDDDKIHIPPVVVYRRDGINYIVNGQHTIDIVLCITKSRDTSIWCRVFEKLTYEHEEELFPNPTEMLTKTEDKR